MTRNRAIFFSIIFFSMRNVMERVKKDFLTEGVLRSVTTQAREGGGMGSLFSLRARTDVDWKVR